MLRPVFFMAYTLFLGAAVILTLVDSANFFMV